MNFKQEQIEGFLATSVKVGDKVSILGLGTQDKTKWGNIVVVTKVLPDNAIAYTVGVTICVAVDSQWKKYIDDIGYNPFPVKRWDSAIRFISFELNNILSLCGYDYRTQTFNTETINGHIIPELDWNPVLVNSDGDEVVYQRDFCWTLKDKQLLIDSIYNGIEIGKIVIRKRSWKYVENRVKSGKLEHTTFKDIVDGKQRLNAIIEFAQNKFTDSAGMYFSDMSNVVKRTFMGFSALTYGEIGEEASDEDVKSVFININFAGVPMSQDHIDFVKGIKL